MKTTVKRQVQTNEYEVRSSFCLCLDFGRLKSFEFSSSWSQVAHLVTIWSAAISSCQDQLSRNIWNRAGERTYCTTMTRPTMYVIICSARPIFCARGRFFCLFPVYMYIGSIYTELQSLEHR